MQTLTYRFPADRTMRQRTHIGVVASGDLEVLLDDGTGRGCRGCPGAHQC